MRKESEEPTARGVHAFSPDPWHLNLKETEEELSVTVGAMTVHQFNTFIHSITPGETAELRKLLKRTFARVHSAKVRRRATKNTKVRLQWVTKMCRLLLARKKAREERQKKKRQLEKEYTELRLQNFILTQLLAEAEGRPTAVAPDTYRP